MSAEMASVPARGRARSDRSQCRGRTRSNCLARERVYPSRVVLHLRPWQSAADELEAFVRDPFAVAAHVVDPTREHESGNEARAASVTCRFNGGRHPPGHGSGGSTAVVGSVTVGGLVGSVPWARTVWTLQGRLRSTDTVPSAITVRVCR
jgi:hypothetical protein